ncbi:MAG TPA: AAA family ATPase [Gemmatimonadales bacterium]|nr:AAA family ATPase [Gemmatimonadales bacterium]
MPTVNIASLRLRCFGPPSLRDESDSAEPLVLLAAGKPLLLLAYLVAQQGRGTSRETLTTLGWGERDDAHAKASLRQALYRLRQLLGRDALTEEGTTIQCVAPLSSDWEDATRAVAAGDDALLLATVNGRYLDGLESDDGDLGGGWLAAERLRWERQLRDAAVREGRRQLVAGHTDAAIALAERALAAGTDHLAAWTLYLDGLAATEVVTRIEDGVARLEAAGEYGLLGTTDPGGWRLLAKRVRRDLTREAVAGERTPTAPGLLPFIGREAVLSHVQRLLLLPAGESRRIVAVIAGAGFGKSRFLRELRLRQHGSPVRLIQVEARRDDSSTPFALLNRVVEALAELPEALGMDPNAARALVAVNARLAERFPGIERAPLAAPSRAALDGALTDLIGAVGEHQPLCLAVDDAQWGDLESTELLNAAFSSAGTGRAVYLVATRDLVSLLPPHWHPVHLASLTTDDLVALLRTELPTFEEARQREAASALVLVTGGVPIYVMRALQQLTRLARAGAPSEALLAAIPALVLHRDPAFPTDDADRYLLGYLAIAGGIVEPDEFEALQAAGLTTLLRDRLAQLERAGLVVPRGKGFQLSHDLVQRQATEDLSAAEHRRLALQHARWLNAHGLTLPDLQRAVHLWLTHGAVAEAAEAVRQWRRRVAGGPRGRALAALILPAGTTRAIRWQITAAATPTFVRNGLAAAAVVGLVGWGITAWLAQPVSLRLDNVPRVPGIDPANVGRVQRNVLPPIFTVRDRLGRRTTALDGKPLEIAGWSPSVDSATLNATDVISGGRVASTTLRVYSSLADSHVVSFRVGRLRPIAVTVFRGFDHQSLDIVGGVMNGQLITRGQPEIRVSAGDSLVGFVELRYSTPSQAALWMLAETSTMGLAIEDTATVITLHGGALNAVTEPIVRRRAPRTPGRYWLMWVFAAERDAVSILSLTNWRCVTPRWNDGNDLATAPDSMLRSVWGGGRLLVQRDLCEDGMPAREGQRYSAATLRVVVE